MEKKFTRNDKSIGQLIRVRGLVQGVGFRPFVWRLARDLKLGGEVANDASGVLIEIWGPEDQLENFITQLTRKAPILARIDALECSHLGGKAPRTDFTIRQSRSGEVTTTIVPDAATCDECRQEIFDPHDRRYLYPFTNCTNCGPRLTITYSLPYDRANTSMADFDMCPRCLREYEDPSDRRFHAQPNACPTCGPSVCLSDKEGELIDLPDGQSALEHAAELICQGRILAIKGLGGFHLACDGSNAEAVQQLRLRKQRYDKPLALMVRNFAMAEKYVSLDEVDRQILATAQAPILLMHKKRDGDLLPDELAPGQNHLGMMLPYTPLHHVLMHHLDVPIVLTSGNRSDEPQVIENDEAREQLATIADAWLMHDRAIVNRLDDSVIQRVLGSGQILRRARGYAPQPFVLPGSFRTAAPVLAMGGELKNTFCLLKDGQAILSQHIGDLENPAAHRDYRKNLELYCQTNQFTPTRIAVDLHPDYFSTRFGEQLADDYHCALDHIQHHHAHIAACLIEHGVGLDEPPVVGVALDGLGYGADQTLWGGEFFLTDYHHCQRIAHFLPVSLPGGERAHYEPWRNSYAHLLAAFGGRGFEAEYGDLDFIKYLHTKPLDQIALMIKRRLNSPEASSAGRLFDAVAAILGLTPNRVSYEGQAAMQLQALAENHAGETGVYGYTKGSIISWKSLWKGILDDLQQNMDKGVIAARFHNTLIRAIAETASQIATDNQIKTIVLSGGVFQNSFLLAGVQKKLQTQDFHVLSPTQFPANDGGLSLGQAILSSAKQLRHEQRSDR